MPPDPYSEFIHVAAGALARLVHAHQTGDQAAIAAELGRLLAATARYSSTGAERRDAALVGAISRL